MFCPSDESRSLGNREGLGQDAAKELLRKMRVKRPALMLFPYLMDIIIGKGSFVWHRSFKKQLWGFSVVHFYFVHFCRTKCVVIRKTAVVMLVTAVLFVLGGDNLCP